MKASLHLIVGLMTALCSVWGCHSYEVIDRVGSDRIGMNVESTDDHVVPVSYVTEHEIPVGPPIGIPTEVAAYAYEPRTLSGGLKPEDYWDLSLDEVVQIALANSDVLRDLGARIVNAPTASASAKTVYDPAIRASDPLTGPQAALSAYDAEFTTRLFTSQLSGPSSELNAGLDPLHQHIYNTLQIITLGYPSFAAGSGAPGTDSSFYVMQNQISKRAATGTEFSVTNNIIHFGSGVIPDLNVNNTDVAFRVVHPLLKGGGIEYNRIAGANALPGRYNGVVLARIGTDISLADFEQAVTNFVYDVEIGYWDLQYAYRDLDKKITARDDAMELWRTVRRRFDEGDAGADEEAAASEQYYALEAQVENALVGVDVSRTINLPVQGGVYRTERQLRKLMGLPVNDGRLIRPASDPTVARIVFDWPTVVHEALSRRVELRRQKWIVKRRELELRASHNELLPQLDLFAQYRTGYLSSEFVGQGIEGDSQQGSAGLQFSVPLGRRQGFAAIRNAELQLTRERAILSDQELQVTHQMSAAFTETDRAYHILQTTFRRLQAAYREIEARRKKYEEGAEPLQFLLDSRLRSLTAETEHVQALIDYNIALTNIELQRGTLLQSSGVVLQEGSWPTVTSADNFCEMNACQLEPQVDMISVAP